MKVVHCKRDPYDVYIGRGSKWGNPFRIGQHGNRAEVIEKYKAYILAKPELLKALPELYGKTLGCYCAPKACHGDVLIQLCEDALAAQYEREAGVQDQIAWERENFRLHRT